MIWRKLELRTEAGFPINSSSIGNIVVVDPMTLHLKRQAATLPFIVKSRQMRLRAKLDSFRLHDFVGDFEFAAYHATARKLGKALKKNCR